MVDITKHQFLTIKDDRNSYVSSSPIQSALGLIKMKRGVKPARIIIGMCSILAIYLVFGQGSGFLCNLIGFMYPAYASTWNSTCFVSKKQIHETTQPNVMPILSVNARWAQNGVSVAGGHGYGGSTSQLAYIGGLFVDDDQTMIIGDICNNRIVQWKMGDANGTVVAGGNGEGKRLDQLKHPNDVLIEKETDSIIICDWGNRRVVRWPRRSGTTQGEILLDDICCTGLAMDDQRYLYVSNCEKNEVKRYLIGDKNGTLVAGGNGEGAGFHQLNSPRSIFVDRHQAVYVSDYRNHRVMKWNKKATEGIVIAGGQGNGSALRQLPTPVGLFVDTLGTLYVADGWNHRVMRWPQGAKQGTVIAGGFGEGAGANQFNIPIDVSFDRHGNLYVSDNGNSRVQRFSLK